MKAKREVFTVDRSKIANWNFDDGHGNHCTLGWFVLHRGGDLHLYRQGLELWCAQSRRIFADIVRLKGETGANEWSARVIDINNFYRGRERERMLRVLFADVRIRIVFTGRAAA